LLKDSTDVGRRYRKVCVILDKSFLSDIMKAIIAV